MSNDSQLEVLQNLNDVLSNKDSFYLTFTANKSVFTQKFDVPITLNPNRKYEAALHNFTTSNYQINIDETNNKFYYQWKNDNNQLSNEVITFEKGAYEVKDISNEIIRFMKEKKHWDEKNPPFSLSLNISIFKSVIEISGPAGDKLTIDFTKEKTIRHILGFESKVLTKGHNISDNTVQITSSSSILIKCSIISGSYHNGKPSTVLYSLPAYLVPTGFKINVEVSERMYLPVNASVINRITFEIVDDNDKVLDFKGETVALAVHLRQI